MRFEDNSLSIGKTPLVKLNHVAGSSSATVWAKIEGRNPSYSVKCRIGASMVWDAEKRGVLAAGKELVEPPSGTVWAKIEGRNPSYSVKCRIGASMVWDAEKRGVLAAGKELVEPTSGNTGIALAF